MDAQPLSAKHRQQLRAFAPDHLKVIDAIQKEPRVTKRSGRKQEAAPAAQPGEIVIDLSNLMSRLTVGDVEDVENASGLSVQEIIKNLGRGRMGGVAAIIWVLRRKDEDPEFTYEQARSLPLDVFTAAVVSARKAKPDPLEASASPSA